MTRLLLLAGLADLTVACASPRGELQSQLVDFGLKPERASCLARELDDRLESEDVADLADFIGGLNEAGSAGGALDALLRVNNAAATAALVPASVTCAFN